jgi:hypothetical protein
LPFKVETKVDFPAERTGRVAIEVGSTASQSKTGIMAAEAQIWAHVTTKRIFLANCYKLKQFVIENEPDMLLSDIGKGTSIIKIYDLLRLKGVFHQANCENVEDIVRKLLKCKSM